MAWVIKYGVNYIGKCRRCSCEFGYHKGEIIEVTGFGKIKCPACGYLTIVREGNK